MRQRDGMLFVCLTALCVWLVGAGDENGERATVRDGVARDENGSLVGGIGRTADSYAAAEDDR
jgi:hypothetical protein